MTTRSVRRRRVRQARSGSRPWTRARVSGAVVTTAQTNPAWTYSATKRSLQLTAEPAVIEAGPTHSHVTHAQHTDPAAHQAPSRRLIRQLGDPSAQISGALADGAVVGMPADAAAVAHRKGVLPGGKKRPQFLSKLVHVVHGVSHLSVARRVLGASPRALNASAAHAGISARTRSFVHAVDRRAGAQPPAVAVPLNNIGAGARPSSPTSPWSSSASTPLPVRPGATWPVGSLRSWSTRPPNPKRNESPPRTVLGAILISPFSDPSLDAALGQLKASPSLHTPLLRLPRARRATPRGARTRAGHRRPAVPRQPRAVTARIKQADVRPPVAQVQSSMHHEDGRLPRSPVTRPSVPPARPSFMTLRLPESARSRRSRPTPH
jgi:hypothetical protein